MILNKLDVLIRKGKAITKNQGLYSLTGKEGYLSDMNSLVSESQEIKKEILQMLDDLLFIGIRIGREEASAMFEEGEFTNDNARSLRAEASKLIGKE